MRLLKKILLLVIVLTIFFGNNSVVQAFPTPIFNSLTPKLQEIVKLEATSIRKMFPENHPEETLEELAERNLIRYYITIDGNLYKGRGGPMKLANEDIESLYNLPNVKQLNLEWFNLEKVDINKFLGINNNKTIEMVLLNDCWFDTCDDEKVKERITNKEYTIGTHPCLWIAWPGVNPDDIFLGR